MKVIHIPIVVESVDREVRTNGGHVEDDSDVANKDMEQCKQMEEDNVNLNDNTTSIRQESHSNAY